MLNVYNVWGVICFMCPLTEEILNDRTKTDSIFQELLQQCILAEEQYRETLSRLSEDERESLERYISLCEELEYRRTVLALEMQQ